MAAEDFTLCDPDTDDATIQRALIVANNWLYRASGRQFPGLCTDTIRPCGRSGIYQMLAYSHGGSRPLTVGCYDDSIVCGCRSHPAVRLPGRPVSTIAEVLVNGAPFADYELVDDGWLIRTDGASWPLCPDLPGGSYQITYSYGTVPDQDGILALERLACELIAGWCQGTDCPECQLPSRLTSISREGDTMQLAALDPFEFLNAGRFGIYEVDEFVALANPFRTPRAGRVRSARDFLRRPYHRVR